MFRSPLKQCFTVAVSSAFLLIVPLSTNDFTSQPTKSSPYNPSMDWGQFFSSEPCSGIYAIVNHYDALNAIIYL